MRLVASKFIFLKCYQNQFYDNSILKQYPQKYHQSPIGYMTNHTDVDHLNLLQITKKKTATNILFYIP